MAPFLSAADEVVCSITKKNCFGEGELSRASIEAIRAGYHLVRNPVIFSHFARLRLGTDAGLGIPNMIRIASQHGVPEPEILVNSGQVRVVFRFKA